MRAEVDVCKGKLFSSSLPVCSEISFAADSLGCRDGGWCGGMGEAGSGRGGRPESIGSIMRWLCAR